MAGKAFEVAFDVQPEWPMAKDRVIEPTVRAVCGDRVVTYRGLYEHVNRFGNALRERDVRMEERVMLLLPDSPEFAFAFFGAMKAGSVAVPLNTNLKPDDYEYFLNDSRARVLVIDSGLAGQLGGVQAKDLKCHPC